MHIAEKIKKIRLVSTAVLFLALLASLAAPSVAIPTEAQFPPAPEGLSSEAWQAIRSVITRDQHLANPAAVPATEPQQLAKLTSSDGAAGDHLGYSAPL